MNPGHLLIPVAVKLAATMVSWLLHRIRRWLRRKSHCAIPQGESLPITPIVEPTQEAPNPLFRTFDLVHDLQSIIGRIDAPQAVALIEDRPSTAYCLALVVVTNQITDEWYVFRRGRIAFQGTGGGIANSRAIFGTLRQQGVPMSAWVLARDMADALESARVTWPEVRHRAIPMAAAPANDHLSWEIKQNAKAILAPAVREAA